MSDVSKCQVYIYQKESFIDVTVSEGDTCEDLCSQLCKRFGIGPLVQLLVGLRNYDERWFLPPCARPQAGRKYEFRVRFKIPKLSNLKTLDRALFNYYYYQLRHDLLRSKISEIEHDEYKNKILGYVVNDMYRKMVEDGVSVTDLKRTYEEYIPRKINKEHSLFFFNWARSKVFNSLNKICYREHDADYVKSVYIDDIDNIAPGYLYEEYNGSIPYPKDDGILKTGKCRVKVKFVPYLQKPPKGAKTGKNVPKDDGDAVPGLKVFYSREWIHVANIDEIFTILVEGLTVNISLKDQSNLYSIDFSSQTELDSFVTCLAGYYRLMCKWTVYLCKPYLYSPSLNRLTELKCHGPIGGKFSYRKIAEKNSSVGANIVRQCELYYDTYYVDILERENQMKTYKLTYGHNRWHVHRDAGEVSTYDELLNALRNLNPDIRNLYRLSPTEHDKSPNLLLCIPQSEMNTKRLMRDAHEMRQVRPQIINAAKELVINRNALKNEGDGFFERTRAELLLPNNSKTTVTLRLLRNDKKDEFLSDFLQLADFWSGLDSMDIVKLYGVTLFKPISMVLESSRDGPLDEFLRRHRHISLSSLIEVAHSLARGLYYLQENGLVHGRIRCASMLVTTYDRNENRLIAKLGDPGLRQQQQYTEKDLLWIPLEYHELGQREVQLLKQDLKADIWACSTTLWEIFSRGKRLMVQDAKQFIASGHRLRAPPECDDIKEIYQCMYNGWLADPDKRFAPQMIISKLVQAKQKSSYCVIGHNRLNGTTKSTNGSYSKQSILSIETESTLLHSRTDVSSSSYVKYSSDCEVGSNASSECSSQPLISNGGSSQFSAGSSNGWDQEEANEFMYDCPDFIELPYGAKVIFQGELGQGHYGKVYRGCIDDGNYSLEVALKTINNFANALDLDKAVKDFKREVSIMKSLNHRNIVRFIDFIDEPHKLIVVMEFVENGSLLDYLSYKRYDLTKSNLLRFAKDIANGMNHLFERKIIHRDLAARNILVQSRDCVKISDFGLAQVTDGNNYYVAQSSRHLPIKWYAPETLCTQKYSFQSDAWSYGVTLYEMFTFGETPYPEHDIISGDQLYALIVHDNVRLKLGGNDRDVYERLMDPCFNLDSRQRPMFVELLKKIEELIDQYGEMI
ncbi:tyrosine-protein kinase hopscotch [Toxorhynchites rutilus septentrionalis]|uniref:tyrosine-protein kinase hopscotch n=1 Tax=Toxorhynchites rutilus septentrionalis TaxID=329112 RepID=UPI00247960F3|nr:tyrosine-protein kinase hopscotch [Toxorhynchites rutilus septentrionalis]XP_055637513.1 tyrosine-protein kinase hopscotch [Toxorhynchites rutilus septentrionalis]XP_055637514.1 tyrosine-protein kinase hopscotch [Toxorhynchites rutilus septentrionalis]XP_055637515.1 tyrosine-protein kinase hopscotch [Toxorhynchites rutilus septentrionalis]XP_055637516.1 tyrosine-protein kinase hopscotch [Toxorhynchites rutilus septentrionalis]XP_055637518.1 tyrosine-protein kinase hopscotch [Toxorhynchites 